MADVVKELKEKLFYEKKNGLLKVDDAVLGKMQDYCEGYKAYLDAARGKNVNLKEWVTPIY